MAEGQPLATTEDSIWSDIESHSTYSEAPIIFKSSLLVARQDRSLYALTTSMGSTYAIPANTELSGDRRGSNSRTAALRLLRNDQENLQQLTSLVKMSSYPIPYTIGRDEQCKMWSPG